MEDWIEYRSRNVITCKGKSRGDHVRYQVMYVRFGEQQS